MRLPIALLAGVAVATPLGQQVLFGDDDWLPPSKDEGLVVARTLVARESLANINTVNKHGVPVSAMEYYADCDGDGNPYWLVVDIGLTFQNIRHGLAHSWTIRVGDHPALEKVDNKYPGGIPASPAGLPRLNLFGTLTNVTGDAALEACFVARHPDAKWWLPSRKKTPHRSHWAKLNVELVYMVGGFGDRAYIGEIDAESYHNAKPLL